MPLRLYVTDANQLAHNRQYALANMCSFRLCAHGLLEIWIGRSTCWASSLAPAYRWLLGCRDAMTVRCSWCLSPYRQVVEEQIAAGSAVAEVSRAFGLSRDQWKHHKGHGTLASPDGVVSLAAVRAEVLDGGGGPYTSWARNVVWIGRRTFAR